ncbi:hypothetical protein HRI_003369000 [Hibiscus trionum]|uniref:Reverse transcriptase domain-containing protein n=1 Tax=Hibiscus trionum TaxID=183268 RepID=A0A9W7IKZ5_HIBTR|nr:hypothetical protein HRI_003369000 [Hibiscus trionum]
MSQKQLVLQGMGRLNFFYAIWPNQCTCHFCTLMNQVFHDVLDKFVVIYLDDIMVYSSTLEDHEKHLQLVLQRLRDNQLFVKREKCEFAQTQIQFLGHLVGQGYVRMDGEKVKAI